MRINGQNKFIWVASASAAALSGVFPATALAQTAPAAQSDNEIVVTATRRSASVQDVPINIQAVTGADLEAQGLRDLSELGQIVPGLHIVDQGARSANRIVVRGLNLDGIAAAEGLGNGGGGTVATYVGEIPLYVDFRLNDMERVEVLLGPQGTLYGSGTLAGAIRYVPNRPSFEGVSGELRGSAYGYSEADDISTDFGATLNVPLSDTFAIRANIDMLSDTGFIDQPFLVRQIGVSDPDATGPAAAANLRRQDDVNSEDTLSGRIAARWQPAPWLDTNLTYYYQRVESGGRQVSGSRSTLRTGEYESALRVPEPNERENQLLALEVSADLGFAELTSATGYSEYVETGQRDQTDLLITLAYSYEAFPTFTAFTREDDDQSSFNQELRLVSTIEGPFSWIVGAFYNKFESESTSREFTPGYAAFLGGSRPDNLEYISSGFTDLTEQAVYGELSYELTPRLTVTGGARWYSYELDGRLAVDLPLLNTVFSGRAPDSIVLNYANSSQSDDGWLFKFNASYDVSDNILAYATVSEGYRIGDENGVTPCVGGGVGQSVCGQPDELSYTPDQTLNYEVGIKSQTFGGRLTLNGSLYYIEWSDPQIASATLIGLQPITKNGEGAETTGLELSFDAVLTDRFSLRGSYAYTNAELTQDAPRLVRVLSPSSFSPNAVGAGFVAGRAGDRLPGSPQHQATLFASYTDTLANGWEWSLDGGLIYKDEIFTRVGNRGQGIALPSYTLTNVSASLEAPSWRATFFVENLFDEFIESGARGTPDFNRTLTDAGGGPVRVRSHYTDVLPPRQVGVRVAYSF